MNSYEQKRPRRRPATSITALAAMSDKSGLIKAICLRNPYQCLIRVFGVSIQLVCSACVSKTTFDFREPLSGAVVRSGYQELLIRAVLKSSFEEPFLRAVLESYRFALL
jgi:hypothetical protein